MPRTITPANHTPPTTSTTTQKDSGATYYGDKTTGVTTVNNPGKSTENSGGVNHQVALESASIAGNQGVQGKSSDVLEPLAGYNTPDSSGAKTTDSGYPPGVDPNTGLSTTMFSPGGSGTPSGADTGSGDGAAEGTEDGEENGANAGLGEGPGGTTSPSPYELPDIDGPNPERVEHVDTEDLRNMLQQIVDAQKQQNENRVDNTVQQGIDALTRAMEDAAKSYQTQRDQASADEAQALDNQALYSEARGDRGGIGAAQYAAIQNTAAQNRRAVNDAQVKLGTDTARQIADLRAQGEFEKADQLLSLAQSHLSQLMSLEQWALGTNLGVDEFNSQLQQWVDEYNLNKQKFLSDLDLSAAQLVGAFGDASRTYEAESALRSSLANSGNALLQAGIMPSSQQLQAMGMTQAQAQEYMRKKGLAF